MRKPWTAADDRTLRRLYGAAGVSMADIAVRLDRSRDSVHHRARQLGLLWGGRWTPQQIATVRELFATHSNGQIAAALGKTRVQVYRLTSRLGLRRLFRWTKAQSQALQRFIVAKHPLGWSDAEMSEAWNHEHPELRISREWVREVRRGKCHLPNNAYSDHRRRRVAEKTSEQLRRAGVRNLAELRSKTFGQFAERNDWPAWVRPRAVQILNLLYEHGPHTRRQIADQIGMPWKGSRKSLVGNGEGGSYLAELMRKGLVVQLRRIVKGKGRGHSVSMYTIAPHIRRNAG